MRKFAHAQVDKLLRSLAAQVKRTAGAADPGAVHDLRVAVRRLSRALRSFAQFFPGKSWKRIRKRLSGLMELTASVRDNDIALELLEKAGLPKRARVALAVHTRRREAEVNLRRELQDWITRNVSRAWREELGL